MIGAGVSVLDDAEKVTIRLPKKFLRALDFLVEVDDMPSRSQAIRTAIRDFVYARVELVKEKMKQIQDAEKAIADAEEFKESYLKK
jgi:metal-responsive CopG/Arc/MetJ family transcriptional regulator